MFLQNWIDKLPIKSNLAKLLIGTLIVGLVVGLGLTLVLSILGFAFPAWLTGVIAGFCAGVYAARVFE